jgi:hypothetical protein
MSGIRRPAAAALGALLVASCSSGQEQSAREAAPICAPGSTSSVAGTVALQWDAPPRQTQGYRVYWGTSSHAYAQALGSGDYSATTSYTVSGLQSGQTYFFAVTAVNAAGAESAYSNEVAHFFAGTAVNAAGAESACSNEVAKTIPEPWSAKRLRQAVREWLRSGKRLLQRYYRTNGQ